ncbi:hypothetical protein ACTXK0_08540 [Corynebacterium variabile]
MKSAERWTEDAMRARSQRLVSRALDYWTYAETDFHPPEVVRPTEPMGEDTSFRNRPVTAYEYGDAAETVTDWTDLIQKLLKVILQQNRTAVLEFAESDSLLTTDPASREGSWGLRTIDPSLGVWVNTDTDSKIAMFHRLFAALDLDPEELVFTLRPTKDSSGAADAAEVPDTARIGTYASLTKFSDAVAEAAEMKHDPAETTALRTEFAGEFDEFKRANWMQDFGGQPLAAFTSARPVDQMTADQVLAVISGLFAMETMFGPGAVHQSIVDWSMSRYLGRLAELG